MPKISMQKGQKLIRAVRANPELYDSTSSNYSDHIAKARLWKNVASTCDMTQTECKSMWKNLRDCYRITRNRATINPKARRWKFYDLMEFIGPYIKDRSFDRSVSQRVTMEVENDEESFESGILDKSLNMNGGDGEFTTIQYWTDSGVKADIKEPQLEPVPKPFVSVEDHSSDVELIPDSPIESEHDSFDYVLPEALNNGTADNSLKMFFDAMFASTSQMPLNLQRCVKTKVFAAVLECEEEAERLKSSSPIPTQVKTEL